MGTYRVNLFDGTPTSTANQTSSETDQFTVGGASLITFETAYGRTNTGLKIHTVASTNCLIRRNFAVSALAVKWTFEYTMPSVAPSAGDFTFMTLRNAGTAMRFQLSSLGRLQILDAASAAWVMVNNGAGLITWGARYRFECVAVAGASTTTGAFTIKAYAGGTSTQLGITATSTTANIGTTAFVSVQVGVDSSSTLNIDHGIDELQMEDATGTALPEYFPVNAPPTVDAGNNQTAGASSLVTLTAIASDVEGPITAIAWTWDTHPTALAGSNTGITNANALSCSFTTAALGSLYVARCTVTDNSSATNFDTVEIRVPVAGATSQRITPGDGTQSGTWGNGGGAATAGAALSDELSTTWTESPPVSASPVSKRVRVTPGLAKSTGQLKETFVTDIPGTANGVFRLFEGATLRQQWTLAPITNTEVTQTLTITTPGAITDWQNLFKELEVTT